MKPDDKVLGHFDEQLRGILKDATLQPEPVEDLHTLGPSPQREPVENLQSLVSDLDHVDRENSERMEIQHRLVAIEREMEKRRSRGFASYLVAICIGVAGTLACQSYGGAAKRIIATKTPELAWSPETRQIIASWMKQLGWTNASVVENTLPVPERPRTAPVAQTAPENVPPVAPAVPSIDPEQVHQMALDLAALRQTVGQIPDQVHQMVLDLAPPRQAVGQDPEQAHQTSLDLAALRQTVGQVVASQDQMAREITRLQASDQEILEKIQVRPAPRPITASARRPSVGQPSSRAPTPLH